MIANRSGARPLSRRRFGTGLALMALVTAGCSSGGEAPSVRHPLPRLPRLGGVTLPPGFVGYEERTAPFASRHPVHVDSAFFELDPSRDFGGNRHCQAQITVSPHDPQVTTPGVYTALLGTKLCDAAWMYVSAPWREQPTTGDRRLWVTEFSSSASGLFGTSTVPAVAAVLFAPQLACIVGLWSTTEVYSLDEAVATVQAVAGSVG